MRRRQLDAKSSQGCSATSAAEKERKTPTCPGGQRAHRRFVLENPDWPNTLPVALCAESSDLIRSLVQSRSVLKVVA